MDGAAANHSDHSYQLDLSENPFPPLPSVLSALCDVMGRVNHYPEFLPDRLPRLVADRLGLLSEQIVVGPGATGVALQVMQAVLAPGRSMVFASPTFDGYPILCGITGSVPVAVPLDPAGNQDLEGLVSAVDDRVGLVVVCRPHNPTGTLVAPEELEWFLDALPRRVIVILDEAYVEFVPERNRIDAPRLVSKYSNVVVLRTFSKAFGLAGLRIGYGFGAVELATRIRRWQLPFGMNSAATVAVSASYAAEAELEQRVEFITTERDILRTALLRGGISVPDSSANFLFLRGGGISAALARDGIVAKTYTDGSARIAVGDPDADMAVLRALTHAAPAARDRITM